MLSVFARLGHTQCPRLFSLFIPEIPLLQREKWIPGPRVGEEFSDTPTDQSAEASSDDSDRLTDDLSSDSSV